MVDLPVWTRKLKRVNIVCNHNYRMWKFSKLTHLRELNSRYSCLQLVCE